MSEQDDLDQKRDAIIKQITEVFPPEIPAGLKLINEYYLPVSENLLALLQDMQWQEIIKHPSIIYYLTEVDYLREITDEAYQYFLPAYLVATMYLQSDLYSMAYEKIRDVLSKFTLDQIEVLMTYFEFQAKVFRDAGSHNEDRFEAMDDMILRLMLRRDELAKDKAK